MHTFYSNFLILVSSTCFEHPSVHLQEDLYRGADKSLARPGRKQATATKL
jgi:hypothetical protein